MFFALSKVLWFLLQPSSVIALLIASGALLALRFDSRAGRYLLGSGIGLLFIGGLSPLGGALILPLEERFARPPLSPDDKIAGIVVLGGAEDQRAGEQRRVHSFNESGERLAETVILARRYPQAKVVFTGGSGDLLMPKEPEAEAARRYFLEMGLEPQRLIIETQSRNTHENAVFTRKMIEPQKGERWLLVTSAYHMPRAVGCFRKAGLSVEAYPVDYRTGGASEIYRPFSSIPEGLKRLDLVFKEYVGLLTYYLTDRTDALFPRP